MKMRFGVALLCLMLNVSANNVSFQKHIVIVTASYKNAEWYKRNLDSVFNQDYDNWTLVYVDDRSPDNTADLVCSYVMERGFADKVILMCNENRCGAMENQCFVIRHFCKPTDIVVILDGDDWLAHDQVLSYINSVYADGTTWLTYGQFKWYPYGDIGFCAEVPAEIVQANAFREHTWVFSHLRTFYAGLFHKIKFDDFLYQSRFFPMAPDLAIMYPMIEMARDHVTFIPEVLLEYNAANPLNEHRLSLNLQQACDKEIRSRARYEKIQSPF